jgi:hypothetical protein
MPPPLEWPIKKAGARSSSGWPDRSASGLQAVQKDGALTLPHRRAHFSGADQRQVVGRGKGLERLPQSSVSVVEIGPVSPDHHSLYCASKIRKPQKQTAMGRTVHVFEDQARARVSGQRDTVECPVVPAVDDGALDALEIELACERWFATLLRHVEADLCVPIASGCQCSSALGIDVAGIGVSFHSGCGAGPIGNDQHQGANESARAMVARTGDGVLDGDREQLGAAEAQAAQAAKTPTRVNRIARL